MAQISFDDHTRKNWSQKIFRFVNLSWFTSQILQIFRLSKVSLGKKNENMNKIDSISNKIYILGDLNIDLSLNDSYIFSKSMLHNKSIPSDVKSYYELCTYFSKLPIESYTTGHCWFRIAWPSTHFLYKKNF